MGSKPSSFNISLVSILQMMQCMQIGIAALQGGLQVRVLSLLFLLSKIMEIYLSVRTKDIWKFDL